MKYLDFFYEISKIARPSYSCGKIADYLCAFAEARGLWFRRDASDNVVIKKPATAGYENAPVVMLQGHVDMVWCVDEGYECEGEGVKIIREGDWIRAEGTTLGADNGIAVAYMLAILDDNTLSHGELECVFTTDEEVGLLGAAAIDLSDSKAKYLLNMDTDCDGVMIAGCCGGLCIEAKFEGEREFVSGDVYKLSVSGLRGGHSGVNIDSNRMNAIRFINHILTFAEENRTYRICEYTGGEKDNAIPNSASVTFCGGDIEKIRSAMELVAPGLYATEEGSEVSLEKISDAGAECFSRKYTDELVGFLMGAPNGVLDRLIDWTPTISDNIGVVRTEGSCITVTVSFRAYDDAYRDRYSARVVKMAEQCGAVTRIYGKYPGWDKREVSPLRDKICEVWAEMTGEEMKTQVIHAGLECGVLTSKLPELDAVSFGPEMCDIHTTKERLNVASSDKYYSFTVKLLAELK